MAFRVELSAEAESDADGILEWLISQHAGETGIRWFVALEEAIASLAAFPERCSLAPETSRFRLKCANSFTAANPTCIEFCLPSKATQ